MVTKVQELQSVLDVAIQFTGDVTQAFVFAYNNGVSLTEALSVKCSYQLPEFKSKDVVNALDGQSIVTKNITRSISLKPEILKVKDTSSVYAITNQSLLDIALQTTGDLKNVFELAHQHNYSLSARVYPGTEFGFKNINQTTAILKALNGQLLATKWYDSDNNQPSINDWLLPQVFPLSF